MPSLHYEEASRNKRGCKGGDVIKTWLDAKSLGIAQDDRMSRFEAYLSPTGAAIFSAGAGGKIGAAPVF
jgi:hypothetical protein